MGKENCAESSREHMEYDIKSGCFWGCLGLLCCGPAMCDRILNAVVFS